MGASSAKVLLAESIRQRYNEFVLNSDESLSLPALSSIPWISASNRSDVYTKISLHSDTVKFITKNDKPHAFAWQTTAAKLKEGARWGIVRTQSITGKVISTLGYYRIIAHERAMKGLVSNSQAVKLKLLDLYQDRFTALQALESLANKDTTKEEYQHAFQHYIKELEQIKIQHKDYFKDVKCDGFDERSMKQIENDLEADIKRAKEYLLSIENSNYLRTFNRARGETSVVEFVKKQMMRGLYELQGINQDMTFSAKRYFALTRGELNDLIEDARKELDDHEADARNVTTKKHHGIYAENPEELVTYDFSHEHLSPARQRQVLTAISFIEAWDILNDNGDTATISNYSNCEKKEPLEVYHATRWRTHRSIKAALKSMGSFVLNIFKSMFLSTQPWLEEDWQDKDFHLNATELHRYLPPNEPMWKKPAYFIMQLAYAVMDVFRGVYDFGSKLVIELPEDIGHDWKATKELPGLDETLKSVEEAIKLIRADEETNLTRVLKECNDRPQTSKNAATSYLAHTEYELSSGEFNDILNAVSRGLTTFTTMFSHNIYAKDPVGGLCFTATYALGIGLIYSPAFCSSFLGKSLVTAFNNMSYAMSASPLGAAVAGGSSIGQGAFVLWDAIMHGPTGIGVNAFYQIGEDPLTVGAYCVAAYALGYLMANGIAGHKIPWLSEALAEDLGTDPSTGYPVIGAKMAIGIYETLIAHASPDYAAPHLMKENHAPSLNGERAIQQFKLVSYLAYHAKTLPKLSSKQQFALERQIEQLFNKEESKSLKKLLYPESYPSIAFQLFAVPLAYIPGVLRLLISPLVSLVAFAKGHPKPAEPMRRAGEFLVDHLKKDTMRVVNAVSKMTYLLYIGVATFVKMFAYLGIMAIGRVAGLFDAKPGHASHRIFATVHNMMRSMGEFLYPTRAMKDISIAHPNDTMLKTEKSYKTLLEKLSTGTKDDKEAEATAEEQPKPDNFTLLNRKGEVAAPEVEQKQPPVNEVNLT
jgi:uncharacterized protein (UPF0335 family)